MSDRFEFDQIARVPARADNVAIATRRLEAGTVVADAEREYRLPHTVLEGHRFVRTPIPDGARLTSWGLPFGIAARALEPGEYVCNAKILTALAERDVDFGLPANANFTDTIETYELDEVSFSPGEQVAHVDTGATFDGFRRSGGRGVGTRNFVAVLATTSRTNGFVRRVAERAAARAPAGVDGVVAVTHTEGGGSGRPNNLDHVLRVLAGFMVHPNVGAVLAADDGTGSYTNDDVRRFMEGRNYPLGHVPHAFFRIERGYEEEVARAAALVDGWLPGVAAARRTPEPAGALRLALQCGGSDAFSGVSGNALAGWVAKEVIRHGGAANLAETDELIGAEPYVLANVRDAATARKFLEKIESFKRYAANHGTTAEGNPSGGNNFRGLYNIALKSLGAARKKDPEVRLDYVIDYGQPMRPPGYYFMDSPGNDLESIAGQVASGSNLILFITGNGSITNFPFVPTLKFVTTTGRFELLANEMDVNAGRYNDGMDMDALGAETFELALDIASGQRSKGELAGHAQVSVWRDWPRTGKEGLEEVRRRPAPDGRPVKVREVPPLDLAFDAVPVRRRGRFRPGRARDADQPLLGTGGPPDRRGSGRKPAAVERRVPLRRPGAHRGLRVEQRGRAVPRHPRRPPRAPVRAPRGAAGARLRADPQRRGAPPSRRAGPRGGALRLGERADGRWDRQRAGEGGGAARGDGGSARRVGRRVGRGRSGPRGIRGDSGAGHDRKADARLASSRERRWAPDEIRIALAAERPAARRDGRDARPARDWPLVASGATVVVPDNAGTAARLTDSATPCSRKAQVLGASLAFGRPAGESGFHVMETPTENPIETFTGLGATGVDLMLCHIGRIPLQGHPMLPLVQVTADPAVAARYGSDLDRVVAPERDPAGVVDVLATLVSDVASCRCRPRLWSRGVTEFQLTRGRLGLSM